jgi:hypothetical protein
MMMKTCVLVCLAVLFACTSAPKKECEKINLSATSDFKAVEDEGYVPFYVHEEKGCLAVDASLYGDTFALATYTFEQEGKTFEVSIHTLLEDDGESTYVLLRNGEEIARGQNIESDTNYVEHTIAFGKHELKKGDVIGIAFNPHTNGKIPEGESTAWSRGRWTSLELKPACN